MGPSAHDDPLNAIPNSYLHLIPEREEAGGGRRVKQLAIDADPLHNMLPHRVLQGVHMQRNALLLLHHRHLVYLLRDLLVKLKPVVKVDD